MNSSRVILLILRLFQHTELEHTPKKPLPTDYNRIPFIVGQGDCLGCALGVCCNFLGLMEEILHQLIWRIENIPCFVGFSYILGVGGFLP